MMADGKDNKVPVVEVGTTQRCPECLEDLLIQRSDGKRYCQTCGYDTKRTTCLADVYFAEKDGQHVN